MSKLKMRKQLTQNQKGQMSDDPRDGARNSDTVGREGPPTPAERPPDQDEQDQEAIESYGRGGARPDGGKE